MKHLLITLLLFLGIIGVKAQDSYYYGFCEKDLVRGDIQSLSAGKSNVNFYCFIHLSAEDATLLASNQITHLYFSLGYCSATSVKVTITDDLTGEALYTQTGACSMLKWNDVELTTPYTIEAGKAVYIGYEVTQKYSFDAPVDVVKDNSFGNTEGDIIGKGSSREKAEWSHSSENGYGNLCLLAQVEGENLPHRNLALNSLSLTPQSGYTGTNTTFGILGKVRNQGLDKVTSFTVNYSLDGADAVELPVETAIDHDSIGTFVIPDLMVTEGGTHSITVNIISVNGADDQSLGDNSLTYNFEAYYGVVDRNVLVEMFTSQSCSNCPAGEQAVERALEGHDNAILVSHHSGFAKDVFTSEWDDAYTWFFPESGSFNPGVMFDRRNINEVTLNTDTAPIVFPYTNRARDYVDYALTKPTFTLIALDANYDPASRSLNIDFKSASTKDFDFYDSGSLQESDQDSLWLNVWIVEDNLIAAQSSEEDGIIQNYVHNGVMRESLTGTWGYETSARSHYQIQCQLSKEYDANNVRVVAFLAHYDSNDNNNCVVENAAQARLSQCDGISEMKSEKVMNNECYNLAGQRLDRMQKGINIINGKKIFIR